MTNSYVQLPVDGVGKKTDTQQLSNGVDTVQRQVVSIGDPNTYGNILDVTTEGALYVDQDSFATLIELMAAILEKMPRVTGNDQAAVSIEAGTLPTVTTVSTVSTVTAVTTVSTVTNQTQIGGQEALTAARAQIASGAYYIYNNIVVS